MPVFDTAWWLEHGPQWFSEFRGGPAYEAQERAIVDMLAPLKFDSVFEIGCGSGRITRLVHDTFRPDSYVASDVSAETLVQAEQARAGRNYHLREFDLNEPRLFPDDKADLVIATEVLMHRTVEQTIVDAELMAEIATKYILTADWCEPGAVSCEGNYAHDYAVLFAPYGEVDVRMVPEARQAVVLVTRET